MQLRARRGLTSELDERDDPVRRPPTTSRAQPTWRTYRLSGLLARRCIDSLTLYILS